MPYFSDRIDRAKVAWLVHAIFKRQWHLAVQYLFTRFAIFKGQWHLAVQHPVTPLSRILIELKTWLALIWSVTVSILTLLRNYWSYKPELRYFTLFSCHGKDTVLFSDFEDIYR
jgi:hypothetical protein